MSIYTCHSDNKGTAKRLTTHKMDYVQGGNVKAREITTQWRDVVCGHITSQHDHHCNGCKLQEQF